MRKKIFVVSILAAILIILATITPAIGTNFVKSYIEKNIDFSPLFSVRSERSIDMKNANKISTNYIGKERQLNIYLPDKSLKNLWINNAIKLFDLNPVLLDKLIDRIYQMPRYAKALNNYGISKQDIKNYIRIIWNDPSEFTDEINNIQLNIPFNNIPEPVGIETGDLGCIIIPIVLAPVAVVITLVALFFTLRILTCLNINECGNEILQGIWEQLIQGLKTPK